MKNGIDYTRVSGSVAKLSDDAAHFAMQATHKLNAVSLTRAMQEGYRIACRDHGIPIPEMTDPAVEFGIVKHGD